MSNRFRNDELVTRFVRGEASDGDQACHMAISRYADWTLLWGYGWALYAALRDDGRLFVYNGWYGYSVTTSQHLGSLKAAARKRYGDPIDAGHQVRAVVDGQGGGAVVQGPIDGHHLSIVDAAPETSYGRLDADGRAELAEIDGGSVPSPKGYDG